MKRILPIFLLATTLFAQAPASPESRSKSLNALFSEMWEDNLRHNPEFASQLGDKRFNDRLNDYSITEVNASLLRGRQYIRRLAEFDTIGLPEQDQLSAELMLRQLIEDQEAARFKEWEMPVNQYGGIHTDLPRLVLQLSFDTAKDYEDYILRLGKIPTAFAQVTDNMQRGMEDGRIPPKFLLEKALVQVQNLATQKPEDSPFALPIKKFPSSIPAAKQKEFSDAILKTIAATVLPAYQRFARFMAAQYVPAGRKDPGTWAIPSGDAYYAFRIRQSTTLKKSAAEIHQIGLDEVARDEAEMLVIAKKMGYADLKTFNAALAADPKLHPTSPQQLIDNYKHYLGAMQLKLPELFGHLPKTPLEVVAIPDFLAVGQPEAYYEQGTPDGSRPGRVNVNLTSFATRTLLDNEVISYHEGIPGHHLQISIAQELSNLPKFRGQTYFTAYTEGWALYSERLGKEVGFYTDPYNDYGRLNADTWRAIRLVIDTGVHSQHWTRQQMYDYFRAHSASDDTNINAEIDRYIAWPAQALGYKMGQLKILELRARAQKSLGPKFNLKVFHDLILDSGALPMDILERRVDAWISSQQKT